MHPSSSSFSFRSRIKSLYYASTGVLQFIRQEHNAWIHLVATVVVVVAAWWFHVSYSEAAILAIVIGGVWITEMLNTCIEKTMDFIHPEEHPGIKFIKDLAAGAVLAAAFTAVVVGLLIFMPKLPKLL